ncbi:hypothetical protein AVEN_91791-1 [Araneus ventricosus]|uniref:Uncharacterized protein n=1 Tax=Araneus ventricosus TaxID=182803 RepID=A0A4Y2TUY4_ARAVE|nr:hypothetical protein AVEN_91791-1 [Araneus ventricosus]
MFRSGSYGDLPVAHYIVLEESSLCFSNHCHCEEKPSPLPLPVHPQQCSGQKSWRSPEYLLYCLRRIFTCFHHLSLRRKAITALPVHSLTMFKLKWQGFLVVYYIALEEFFHLLLHQFLVYW